MTHKTSRLVIHTAVSRQLKEWLSARLPMLACFEVNVSSGYDVMLMTEKAYLDGHWAVRVHPPGTKQHISVEKSEHWLVDWYESN